jgi:hypothetical protein
MAILGINTTIQVAKTFDTPKGAISAIAVTLGVAKITIATHGFLDGDVVVIGAIDGVASTVDVLGMVQLNGQIGRVANKTTNDFELEGVDASTFAAFSGAVGTATEVLTWDTLSSAQSVSAPQGAPNVIDVTTLIDTETQTVFGLADSVQITVSGLHDPLSASTKTVRTASLKTNHLPVRVTFQNDNVLLFNSLVSAGDGFEMSAGQPATSDFAFTLVRRMAWYAS